MDHFASVCFSFPLNPQVIFYDFHDRHFDDRALSIIWSHYIQYLLLKAGEYVHEKPNNNDPKLNINIVLK